MNVAWVEDLTLGRLGKKLEMQFYQNKFKLLKIKAIGLLKE
jgi:hypothetical protein